MKLRRIVAGMVLLSCLIAGCGRESHLGGNKMDTSKAMDDYQYMTEVLGFTAEELEGLDVIDICESTHLRKDKISSKEAHEVVELLRDRCKDKNGKNEIFMIMTASGGPGISSDIEVGKICFTATIGNESYLEVYDVRGRKYYDGDANSQDLSDEQAESLATIANRYAVKEWDQYTAGGAPTTGGCTWKLVFQTVEGTYYVYEGDTPDFSTFPPTYEALRSELISISND